MKTFLYSSFLYSFIYNYDFYFHFLKVNHFFSVSKDCWWAPGRNYIFNIYVWGDIGEVVCEWYTRATEWPYFSHSKKAVGLILSSYSLRNMHACTYIYRCKCEREWLFVSTLLYDELPIHSGCTLPLPNICWAPAEPRKPDLRWMNEWSSKLFIQTWNQNVWGIMLYYVFFYVVSCMKMISICKYNLICNHSNPAIW